MKIKICGLTTLEDALDCAQAGVDLLGFNFYPKSPRCLQQDTCARIVQVLRSAFPRVILVGVFVNHTPAQVKDTLRACDLDLAQLSGDEPPSTLFQLGSCAIKALRPASLNDLRAAAGIYPARSTAPAFLIDAYRPGEYGGTGQTTDWMLAAEMSSRLPILMAGGLTPTNVGAAVRLVRPWGVDVASGVESMPGRKDSAKVAALVAAVRAASEEIAHD